MSDLVVLNGKIKESRQSKTGGTCYNSAVDFDTASVIKWTSLVPIVPELIGVQLSFVIHDFTWEEFKGVTYFKGGTVEYLPPAESAPSSSNGRNRRQSESEASAG